MAAPLPEKPALPDAPSSVPATEEIDIWWGSYAGRTMLPGFLLCALLTIVLLALDWYLESQNRRSDLVSSVLLALAGAGWLFQVTRWIYRMIAINYRLTNRRLLYMRGFKLPDSWAIELAQVTNVLVVRGQLERLLRVGRIEIHAQDGSSPLLVLDGVSNPERVARTIRRRVQLARANPKITAEHAKERRGTS